MGRGLWSQETTEVPSPHTSSTTRLASKENTDFLHLVNEDTDEARLRCTPETNCNAVDRAVEQQNNTTAAPCTCRCHGVDINAQNKNRKVNIHAKGISSAPAF